MSDVFSSFLSLHPAKKLISLFLIWVARFINVLLKLMKFEGGQIRKRNIVPFVREQYKYSAICSTCWVNSKMALLTDQGIPNVMCTPQSEALCFLLFSPLCKKGISTSIKKTHKPHQNNLTSVTCKLNSQLNHALYRLLSSCSEVLGK